MSMENDYFFWFQIGIIIIGLVIAHYVIKKFLNSCSKNRENNWYCQVADIIRLPLLVLIWLLGAFLIFQLIGDQLGIPFTEVYINAFRKSLLVVICSWLFFRWKNRLEQIFRSTPTRKIDITTVQFIGRLSTIGVGFITTLMILHIFGLGIAPLLTLGSVGVATIGLAAKDIMGNCFSGIFLQVTRPFVLEDYILIPEKNLEGHIEELGWFKTSIRDKEKRVVYLPNHFFSTFVIVNASRMTHRRVKQLIKISMSQLEKTPSIIHTIREFLVNSSDVDQKLPIHVFLKSFDSQIVEIELEAYTFILEQDAFNRFQQDILLRLEDQIDHSTLEIKMVNGKLIL